MNRAKRIFSRGWLNRALSVLTFGYYPVTEGQPTVKIEFLFRTRSMVLTMAKKSIVFSFVQRTVLFALAKRTMAFSWQRRTMTFSLSGRSMTFTFVGNEPG